MPAPVRRLLTAIRSTPPAGSDPPDADLLARFVASRDEAAFAELVRRHGGAVWHVCRRLVGPTSADDAFQATFLVLACRARSVRKAGSVGSWLVGVAGRVARQMRRSRCQDSGFRSQPEAEVPASFPDPESRMLTSELSAVLAEELARLPDRLRAPVVLCLLDGRTQEQAAAELGGSVRTLRRRLDQAKALLRLRLERRGVVPAIAAGLVAGVGPAEAIPPEMARRAVGGAFEFLAGGATGPAAVVAKGVVMGTAKLKAGVLVVSAAAVLVGLGVGWAGDKPGAESPPVATPAAEPPAAVPPPGTPATGPVTPPLAAPVPARSHRTANFVVSAPSPVMARAVANEAEYQRKELALRWLGKELPDWPAPCEVRFTPNTPGTGPTSGASTFTFGRGSKDGSPAVLTAGMEFRGGFVDTLTTAVPHEVTHAVLATHFGKPLPRWADEGIALTAEPAQEQARHDDLCRKLLADGRGIRLRKLFPMTDYPQDVTALYAQGHSVVRFLLTLRPRNEITVSPALTLPESREERDRLASRLVLLAFIRKGLQGDWDEAMKAWYDFDSVDALEAAWLDWLKKPESRPSPSPAPTPTRPKDDKPDLIPPTKLPGAESKEL